MNAAAKESHQRHAKPPRKSTYGLGALSLRRYELSRGIHYDEAHGKCRKIITS